MSLRHFKGGMRDVIRQMSLQPGLSSTQRLTPGSTERVKHQGRPWMRLPQNFIKAKPSLRNSRRPTNFAENISAGVCRGSPAAGRGRAPFQGPLLPGSFGRRTRACVAGVLLTLLSQEVTLTPRGTSCSPSCFVPGSSGAGR